MIRQRKLTTIRHEAHLYDDFNLNEDAMDFVIFIELLHKRRQLLLRHIRWQWKLIALDIKL